MKTTDYNSHDELVSALKGQDAFVISLAIGAARDAQTKLIDAAIAAGVPWIFPNEWGSDNAHPVLADIPVNKPKHAYREKIEKSGSSAWIGFVNNLWYEYSLGGGWFGIDIKNRTANFFDDGKQKLNTSTLPQCGRGVAALLSLPVTTTDGSPSLSKYRNGFAYISSFFINQHDMLASLQRVTKTSPGDWQISKRPVDEAIKSGHEKVAGGNFMGMIDVLYGTNFKPGAGGDYGETKGLDNKILGLPEEDLDEATGWAIDRAMKA